MQLHLNLPGDLITSFCHMAVPICRQASDSCPAVFAPELIIAAGCMYVLVNIQSLLEGVHAGG